MLHDHAKRVRWLARTRECGLCRRGMMVDVASVLKGKLLLATPPLVDPNFDRTVVLVLEHGEDGSLGLVLNRPTDEEVEEMLPTWRPLISGQAVLFDGGPVE